MILDLLLIFWLILAALLGFRDGSVRKLVSIVMTIVGLILGQMYMREAGDFLIETLGFEPTGAPMLGFLFILVALLLIQALVYKIATHAYKIGGIADRVGGSILGLFQGMIFVSSLLLIFSLADVPSRRTRADSRIYKGVVNIAPQLLDLFMTVKEESLQRLEGLDQGDETERLRKLMRTNPAAADSIRRSRLARQIEQDAQRAQSGIDSLRSSIRR